MCFDEFLCFEVFELESTILIVSISDVVCLYSIEAHV